MKETLYIKQIADTYKSKKEKFEAEHNDVEVTYDE